MKRRWIPQGKAKLFEVNQPIKLNNGQTELLVWLGSRQFSYRFDEEQMAHSVVELAKCSPSKAIGILQGEAKSCVPVV
jgi:ribosomal protein S6